MLIAEGIVLAPASSLNQLRFMEHPAVVGEG